MATTWKQIGVEAARKHPLYGIDGWLLFFLIMHFLGPILTFGQVAQFAMPYGLSPGQFFALNTPSAIIFQSILVLNVGKSIVTILLILAKAPLFRIVAIWLQVAMWPVVFIIALIQGEASLVLTSTFIQWALTCAIWGSYLHHSKRVRVTFEHMVKADDEVHFTPPIETPDVLKRVSMPIRTEPSERPKVPKALALETSGAENKSSAVKLSVVATPESGQLLGESENSIYAQIASELENGNTDKGLWARCYAECGGDETKTKVLYIKRRASVLLENRIKASHSQFSEEDKIQNNEDTLSQNDILFLGIPIKAADYIWKYKIGQNELANACAWKQINHIMHNGVLWVSDQPIKSKQRISTLHLISAIFLVFVISLVVSIVASYIFNEKTLEKINVPPETSSIKSIEEKHVHTYLPMDNMVVNLADPSGERVAQVGITLEVTDAHAADSVKVYMPTIRSGVLMLLSRKTSEELLSPEGKQKLIEEILVETSIPFGSGHKAEYEDDPATNKKAKKPAAVKYPVVGVLFSSLIIQ